MEDCMSDSCVMEDWAVRMIERAVPYNLDRKAADRLVQRMTDTFEDIIRSELSEEGPINQNADALEIRDALNRWAKEFAITDSTFLAGLQHIMMNTLGDILFDIMWNVEHDPETKDPYQIRVEQVAGLICDSLYGADCGTCKHCPPCEICVWELSREISEGMAARIIKLLADSAKTSG